MDESVQLKFIIIEQFPFDLLLGVAFMRKTPFWLNFQKMVLVKLTSTGAVLYQELSALPERVLLTRQDFASEVNEDFF